MSISSNRRGRIVGPTAVGALLITGLGVGGAQAAPERRPLVERLDGVTSASPGQGARRASVAEEASVCTVEGYSPSKITIGTRTREVAFTPRVSGCRLEDWTVGITPFRHPGSVYDGTSSPGHELAVLNPRWLADADAGKRINAVVLAL